MTPTFPDYVFINDDNIREVRITNMRRSEDFEVGPNRQTAYSCKTLYQLRFEMSVCSDKYQEYLDWYEKTLLQGTQWFLMTCPIRGIQYRYRFLNEDLDFRKNRDQMRKTCTIERWGGE